MSFESSEAKMFLFIALSLYYFGVRLLLFVRRVLKKQEVPTKTVWFMINFCVTVEQLLIGFIDYFSPRASGNFSLIGAILIALGFFHTILQFADLQSLKKTKTRQNNT